MRTLKKKSIMNENAFPQAVILLGPPGCGKGTQARTLSIRFGVPHLSTGDLLRDAIKKNTAIGRAANIKMDTGRLVPDDWISKIVEERIMEPDCANGFILDGFPRTMPQAVFLSRLINSTRIWVPVVLNMQLHSDLLNKRVLGRLTCPRCGEIYNTYFRVPERAGLCDKDGECLTRRSDDNEETVRQRMIAYKQQTQPLIEYYRMMGIKWDINAGANPREITNQLDNLLQDLALQGTASPAS